MPAQRLKNKPHITIPLVQSNKKNSRDSQSILSPLSAALDNDKSRKIYYSDTGVQQEGEVDAEERGIPSTMTPHELHLQKSMNGKRKGDAMAAGDTGALSPKSAGGTSSDQVQFVRALTPLGAFSIATEVETNLSIACCGLLLEGQLSHTEILNLLEERLCKEHYRFRCAVEDNNFVEHSSFDVRRHVKYLRLRQDADEEVELRRLVSKFMNVPLPKNQPLWECLVVEGYSKGQFLLFRIHHSLGDGNSLASCFISFCDQSYEDLEKSIMDSIQNSSTQKAKLESGKGKNVLHRLMNTLLMTLWFTLGTVRVVFKWIWEAIRGPDSITVFNRGGKVGTKKRVAFLAHHFDLEEVKDIGKQYNATVNDVILSCISGGMSRYYRDHVDRNEVGAKHFATNFENMRMSIPVNVRKRPLVKRLGNKFGFVVSRVPIGNGLDSVKRLRLVKKAMDGCKKLPEQFASYYLGKLVTRLPIPAITSAFGRLGSMLTFVFSNVRGCPVQLSVHGHKIKELLGFVPCPSGTALGFALLSYMDKISISVVCDEKTIKDPEVLMQCIEDEYQHLKAITQNPDMKQEAYGTFAKKKNTAE
eukprot:CAMPEP_0117449720 /NCGR_PEP_ID=MMETSP0759-20121206/8090_1 /TAXON_ID=63605 /ORGANISM="Percolomonas cosmopolitus, Strain WS" /LENGTH=586 /DNA_ID=CAMNT_0005242203 /DNA_START=93 /DNA_END=1853 /DNA_ORIENTATION=+